jgi:hypothetical protein
MDASIHHYACSLEAIETGNSRRQCASYKGIGSRYPYSRRVAGYQREGLYRKTCCHNVFFEPIAILCIELRNICSSYDAAIERCMDPERHQYIIAVSDWGSFPWNHTTTRLISVIRKRALITANLPPHRDGRPERHQDSIVMG